MINYYTVLLVLLKLFAINRIQNKSFVCIIYVGVLGIFYYVYKYTNKHYVFWKYLYAYNLYYK